MTLPKPAKIFLGTPRNLYLSAPRHWREFEKKAWREHLKSITTDPNTYAGKFLADITQMSKKAEELRGEMTKEAKGMVSKAKEWEASIWGPRKQ